MKISSTFKALAKAAKKAAKVLPSVKVERRKDGAKRVMFTWTKRF